MPRGPRLTVDDRGILDAGRSLGLRPLIATPEDSTPGDPDVHLLLLHWIADRIDRDVEFVALRLRAMGFTVQEPPQSDVGELRRAAKLLSSGRAAWMDTPSPGKPISGRHVADLAIRSECPISEVIGALEAFDIHSPDVAGFVDRFGEDMEFLADAGPYSETTVEHTELYAVAHHVGRARTEVAADLRALGYTIPPADEEFERDVWAESVLEVCLGAQPLPVLARYTDDDGASPLFVGRPERISLSALTAVAMRRGMHLRDTAAAATDAGLRHEAETWFGLGPGD